MLKSLDLFSGVGGITHALRGLASPVMYCEKDGDCQAVLKKLMASGKLPRAPLHGDVTTLSPSSVPKIDLIAAGFPCPGFSSSGLHEGLDHPGSKLFCHVKRLATALKPALLFLENVEGILSNQDIHVVVKSLRAIGYDLWWVVMPAFSVGAPQKRSRWFCLGVLRGTKALRLKPSEPFSRYNWSSEPALRMIPKSTHDQRRRIRMMGNSVVPDCARAAFLSLFTGCRVPVLKLLQQSSRASGQSLALSPPEPAGPLLKSHSRAFACVAGRSSDWQRIPEPPGLLPRAKLGLVLDPRGYRPPKNYNSREATSGIVTSARKISLWSTPRAGNGAYATHVLTERGTRGCLGTQLRFERRTPASQRCGATNPEFAEYLMGFPRGWTL